MKIQPIGLCLTCLTLWLVGCINLNAVSSDSTANTLTNPSKTNNTLNIDRQQKLRDRIEQIARTAQGQVGAKLTVLETGASVTFNGTQKFPMQSVYKFPIGMAVLTQVDQGKLTLDQRIQIEPRDFVAAPQHSPIRDTYPQGVELTLAELLKYMVSESDGTATDVILKLIDGPATVNQYLQNLSIDGIKVADTEKEIGQAQAVQYRNYATPDATLALLRAFKEGRVLSNTSQALLLQLMTETPTGPNRIKGLLPNGTVVAHKTGTSRTIDGVTAATNDVGLVTLPNGQHLAIAVFVSDSPTDTATREAVIAKIARLGWDEWSK